MKSAKIKGTSLATLLHPGGLDGVAELVLDQLGEVGAVGVVDETVVEETVALRKKGKKEKEK